MTLKERYNEIGERMADLKKFTIDGIIDCLNSIDSKEVSFNDDDDDFVVKVNNPQETESYGYVKSVKFDTDHNVVFVVEWVFNDWDVKDEDSEEFAEDFDINDIYWVFDNMLDKC